MPLDITGTLYTAVVGLLDAYAPFKALVPDGKFRPVLATTQDHQQTRRTSTNITPYPKVLIDVAEDSGNERAPLTFCRGANGPDYRVSVTLNLDVRIAHDSETTLDRQTPVEAAFMGALYAGGNNLGVEWITTWVKRGTRRQVESSPIDGNINCPTSRFRIVVTGRPWRSQLKAL